MRIIGISGKAGSGKDYIAENYIKKLFPNSLTLAFADQIKINCMVKYNLSVEEVYGNKTQKVREQLQQEGTENGRDMIDADIWCKYLKAWIDMYRYKNNIETFIITDVRFENEAKFIQQLGGVVIRVHAPKRNAERYILENLNKQQLEHSSETSLDTFHFEHIIYNDPENDVCQQFEKLKNILRSINL